MTNFFITSRASIAQSVPCVECIARSDCTYVQSDLALHSPLYLEPFNQMKSLCIVVSSLNSAGSPRSTVGGVGDLRTEGRWFEFPAWPIFSPGIDDSHCDRIHSSLTIVYCSGNGYAEKAASGLQRILCGVLVKRIPGNHG